MHWLNSANPRVDPVITSTFVRKMFDNARHVDEISNLKFFSFAVLHGEILLSCEDIYSSAQLAPCTIK